MTTLISIDIVRRGLAWSLDGLHFASGGNDNIVCVFADRDSTDPIFTSYHDAAVKALSFCPFQSNLLAVGMCHWS